MPKVSQQHSHSDSDNNDSMLSSCILQRNIVDVIGNNLYLWNMVYIRNAKQAHTEFVGTTVSIIQLASCNILLQPTHYNTVSTRDAFISSYFKA